LCKSHYISRVSSPSSRDYDEIECLYSLHSHPQTVISPQLFFLITLYFFAFLISFLLISVLYLYFLSLFLSLREMSAKNISGDEGRPAREIEGWESRCLTTLWASTTCYKDSCPLHSAFSFSRRWFVLIFSISVLRWAHFL
jgi:hypothetical protein